MKGLVVFLSFLLTVLAQTEKCCSDPCPSINQTCQWTGHDVCGYICVDVSKPLSDLEKEFRQTSSDPLTPSYDCSNVVSCSPFEECAKYTSDKPLICTHNFAVPVDPTPNSVEGSSSKDFVYTAGDFCMSDTHLPICVPFDHCDNLDQDKCSMDGRCKWKQLPGLCVDYSYGWCMPNPDILTYPSCEMAVPMGPICLKDPVSGEIFAAGDMCTPPGFESVPCDLAPCHDSCALSSDEGSCQANDKCVWKIGEACCGHKVGFCQSADTMCTQAFSCAHSPFREKLYQFDDGCLPENWKLGDPTGCDCKPKCADYRDEQSCRRDGCDWKQALSCTDDHLEYCREPNMVCGRMRTCAAAFYDRENKHLLFEDTCLPDGYIIGQEKNCICGSDICSEDQTHLWRVEIVLIIDDVLTEEKLREMLAVKLGIAVEDVCTQFGIVAAENGSRDLTQKLNLSFKLAEDSNKEDIVQACESTLLDRGYSIISSKALSPGEVVEVEQATQHQNPASRLQSCIFW